MKFLLFSLKTPTKPFADVSLSLTFFYAALILEDTCVHICVLHKVWLYLLC